MLSTWSTSITGLQPHRPSRLSLCLEHTPAPVPLHVLFPLCNNLSPGSHVVSSLMFFESALRPRETGLPSLPCFLALSSSCPTLHRCGQASLLVCRESFSRPRTPRQDHHFWCLLFACCLLSFLVPAGSALHMMRAQEISVEILSMPSPGLKASRRVGREDCTKRGLPEDRLQVPAAWLPLAQALPRN